jgi:hypothetical protein
MQPWGGSVEGTSLPGRIEAIEAYDSAPSLGKFANYRGKKTQMTISLNAVILLIYSDNQGKMTINELKTDWQKISN